MQKQSSYSLAASWLILVATAIGGTAKSNAEAPLRLSVWPDEAPLGDGKFEKVEVPMTVHLPAPGLASGAAMVIWGN